MDRELLNTVTQQVVAMLRQRGVTIAPSGRQPAAPAAAPAKPAVAPQPAPRPVTTGRVFVTAEMLARRLAADGGAVTLAANEFLTPNAVDLADQKRLTIRRAAAGIPSAPAPAPASTATAPACPTPACDAPAACAAGSIGIITYRADETIRGMLAGLVREGLPLVDFTGGDCVMTDLRRLCQAVACREVSAGVAILPYAADAVVLANKTKGVRAVQGTRPESVAAAVRHFGANMLILEHAFSTYHQMRTMLRTIAAGGEPVGGSIPAAIRELEGT